MDDAQREVEDVAVVHANLVQMIEALERKAASEVTATLAESSWDSSTRLAERRRGVTEVLSRRGFVAPKKPGELRAMPDRAERAVASLKDADRTAGSVVLN